MPHSSGSHSHSSHSHSSHHSSSRYRSGSSNHRRIQKDYFEGARRYMYYKGGEQAYVYADCDLTEKGSKIRYILLLFYLPFFICIITLFNQVYHVPKALKLDYNAEIVIKDEIRVLDDVDLNFTLNDFRIKTGITPCVVTLYHEQWDNLYENLETCAYNIYGNLFQDEKHFLVVYSEPRDPENYFGDFYIHVLQGDDTDSILTEKAGDRFIEDLNRYLFDTEHYSVNDAITKAFEDTTATIMDSSFHPEMLLSGIFMLAFCSVHCYLMVFYNPNRKYKNAVEIPMESREDVCDYCNTIYKVGEITICPNCGAPLKPHVYSTDYINKQEYYKEV